jgi:hypothetical protein
LRWTGRKRKTSYFGEELLLEEAALPLDFCINISDIGESCRSEIVEYGILMSRIIHSRLVRMASQSTSHNTTVIFPKSSGSGSSALITATVPTEALNKEVFDVAFTMAIGCTQYKQGGCEEMRLDHRFSSAVFLTDHWKYKYLIDIDGMSYSAHFLAFMASESAVMKATVYREFFSDWIQPWYVIIPTSGDVFSLKCFL